MQYKKNFFSYFLVFISFLILTYAFYKSEFYWEGNKRDYYKVYYYLGILLFLVSVIFLFLSENIKIYFKIFFLCSIVSLYLFEIYKITFNASNKWNLSKVSKIYKKRTGFDFDKRKRIEVYNDIKKNDPEVVVSIGSSNFFSNNNPDNLVPLSGVSNAQTIHCNENGYYSIYKSDRYGFKNPDYEWDSKKIEYLLIGDSYTHGSCVDMPNDIGSVLRTLTGKSVLNLGYGGAGTLIEYATLREYLPENVKNIILFFYENDTRNLSSEVNDPTIQKYLNDKNFKQNLVDKQELIDKKIRSKIENEKKYFSVGDIDHNRSKIDSKKIIKFFKLDRTRDQINQFLPKKNRPDEYLPKPQKDFEKILILISELSNEKNINFYFVYLPSYSMINYKNHKNNFLEIKKTVNKLNIPFIDINDDVFKKEKNPSELFPFGMSFGHYTVEGYKKVAEAVLKSTK